MASIGFSNALPFKFLQRLRCPSSIAVPFVLTLCDRHVSIYNWVNISIGWFSFLMLTLYFDACQPERLLRVFRCNCFKVFFFYFVPKRICSKKNLLRIGSCGQSSVYLERVQPNFGNLERSPEEQFYRHRPKNVTFL